AHRVDRGGGGHRRGIRVPGDPDRDSCRAGPDRVGPDRSDAGGAAGRRRQPRRHRRSVPAVGRRGRRARREPRVGSHAPRAQEAAALVTATATTSGRLARTRATLRAIVGGLSIGVLLLVLGLGLLVVGVPAIVGGIPLTILTGSMTPTLPPGTLVVVK